MSETNTNEEEIFTQKLTGRQRLFLRSPAYSVAMVARIQGNISLEALKQAIHCVQRRHMMLQVRVVTSENGDPLFTADEFAAIPVRQMTRASSTHWQQVCLNEYQVPFEMDKGPLIRFILLYSPDVSDLVVFCQHSICDGMSLAYLLYDMLEHLKDPDRRVEPLPAPLVLEEIIPSKFLQSRTIRLLGKVLFSHYNRKWTRAGINFDSEDAKDLFSAYWKHHELRMSSCAIEGEKLSRLISSSRREGVSVNTALTTAFQAAVFELKRTENEKFLPNANIAIDLRRELPSPARRGFGLYASGADCKLQYDSGRTFWENATRFHRQIQRKIKLENNYRRIALLNHLNPGMMESLPFIRYSKYVPPEATRFEKLTRFNDVAPSLVPRPFRRLTRLSTSLIMTNMGRLPFAAEYGQLCVKELFFVPPSAASTEIVVGVVTVWDKLNISICYMENVIGSSTVEKIKHQAMRYLDTATAA
jgi:NRPS condensation-like uncharacterized protein